MMNARTFLLLGLPLLTWLLPVHGEDEARPPEGSVVFGNGDRLSGWASGINEEGNLVWQSDTLHTEVPLRLDQILEMSLQSPDSRPEPTPHVAKVTLTNGDTIHGQLTALDENHVSLKTGYGGLLKIRRSMSSHLDITKSERTIYSGPYDLTKWTIADGDSSAWDLQNGQLISRQGSGVAQSFKVPDLARLSFTVAWRSSLRLRLLLRSDDGETTQPDNCYDLVYNRRFVYLRKRWSSANGTGSRIIGQSANIQELNEKETARFDFYLDNAKGTIALYVDGKQAQVWTDEEPKEGSFGQWIHFISEDGYPVRISRLELSEWSSGKLPDDRQLEVPEEDFEEEGQRIFLRNGDVLVGEVGGVTDGVLEIATAHTPVHVPVERMSSVNLTSKTDPAYEEPKRVRGDVRAWFRSGGRVTFQILSFEAGKIVGKSQTFGEATFDLRAFSRIEFNIYNEAYRGLRQSADW